MPSLRVLVVEDESKLLDNICRGLDEQHFSVQGAVSAEAAAAAITRCTFDAIVLDLRLPEKDGLEFLRELRAAANHTPVLILTALSSVDQRVSGLDSGADDYLTKPFAFAELTARIRALARRRLTPPMPVLRSVDVEFDTVTRRARRGGRELSLSPKETMLLELLMRNAGQTVTRAMITEVVWGAAYNDFSNLIEVFVNRLRHKLDQGLSPSLISTVRGIGYSMREPR